MIYNSKYYNSNHIENSDNDLLNVVVYGTGTLGALAIHALNNRNIQIQYVVDDNFKNWNKDFFNKSKALLYSFASDGIGKIYCMS